VYECIAACQASRAASAAGLRGDVLGTTNGQPFFAYNKRLSASKPFVRLTMQITCRCGQAFTIDAGPFPRNVHCHVCSHRFAVLDTGEILDAHIGIASTTPASTAIAAAQQHSTLLPTTAHAFCTDDNLAAFTEPIEQLRQLDAAWQRECERRTYQPTRAKGLSVAIGIGGTFLTMMAIEAIWFSHVGNPVLIIGTLLGICGGIWEFRRGAEFERAETMWIQTRQNVYTQHGITVPVWESKHATRWTWIWTIVGSLCLAGLILIALISAFGTGMFWIGSTDLEITFRVTDATTGQPIPEAVIDIVGAEWNCCGDCNPPLKLVTDDQGMVKKMCTQCTCTGYSGWKPFFRWTETFHTRTPSWQFFASSPKHEKTELIWIDELGIRHTRQRGATFSTMRVDISLRRLPPAEQ
jgi:hypothetical protein